MSTVEIEREVEQAILAYEDALARPATRTRQMIADLGVIGALSKLVVTAEAQQGFKVLARTGHLEKSFEAIVVRHADQFARDAVQSAQWRLENPESLL